MKETLLLYHFDDEMKSGIENIAQQLGIEVQYIEDHQIHETMGYILNIDGFEKSEPIEKDIQLDKEFLFFAGMNDQQLDLLLEIFKVSGVPFIPYKAMLTERNVEYPFYQLYQNVAHEYEQISGMKSK